MIPWCCHRLWRPCGNDGDEKFTRSRGLSKDGTMWVHELASEIWIGLNQAGGTRKDVSLIQTVWKENSHLVICFGHAMDFQSCISMIVQGSHYQQSGPRDQRVIRFGAFDWLCSAWHSRLGPLDESLTLSYLKYHKFLYDILIRV